VLTADRIDNFDVIDGEVRRGLWFEKDA